jgi:hypothetical protein
MSKEPCWKKEKKEKRKKKECEEEVGNSKHLKS